jgi:hypothetical protein
MATSVVAAKKRKCSDTGLVSHLGSALTKGTQEDLQFAREAMENDEDTARAIASLLRSEGIGRALELARSKDSMEKLEKGLPAACHTFGGLSRGFKWKLFFKLVESEGGLVGGEWIISDQDVEAKLFYALGVTKKSPIPTQHCHARWEGPLYEVCKVRYKAMGQKLQGFTFKTWPTIGYFKHNASDQKTTNKCVHVSSGEDVEITMFTIEQMNKVKDWNIIDNHCDRARLVSALLPAEIPLFVLLKRQHKLLDVKLPDDKTFFEFPQAADMFKTLEVPMKLLPKSKAKAKSKAAAAAAVQRAPRRPPRRTKYAAPPPISG